MELLVVILIVVVLAGIVSFALGKVRESATMSKSTSNLRQLHALAAMYSAENNQKLVPGKGSDMQQWQVLLARQLGKDYVGIWEFVDANGYRPEVETFVAPGWTKSKDYNKNRFWQTGYGMNMQPGKPSVTTPNTQEASWGRSFRLDQITAQSSRAFILTWPEWNAYYAEAAAAKGAFVGKKLNVLFFDGHVETKLPNEIKPLIDVPAARDN